MTCPHCDFENLETNLTCFRCGQVIDLSDVEVEPERLRRGPSNLLARRLAPVWNRSADRPDRTRGRPVLAAFMSIVPGLGHYVVLAAPRRAVMMLGMWAASLLGALVLDRPDTLISWLAEPHWLMTSTHSWIVCDAYQARLRHDGHRPMALELGLVSMAAIAVLYAIPLYGVASELGGRALGHQRFRVSVAVDDPTVRYGDVVEVRRRWLDRPLARGSVVTYWARTPEYVRGDLVGTVRAVGGDEVEWQQSHRRFLVDGRIVDVPAGIRGAWANTADAVINLGPDQVFIFPGYGGASMDGMLLPTKAVTGVVVRIVDPPERQRDL